MQPSSLLPLVEAQCGRRMGLWLAFPPVLEASFNADTTPRRAHTLLIIGALHTTLPILAYPAISAENPTLTGMGRLLLLGLPNFVNLTATLLMRSKLPILYLEFVQYAACMVLLLSMAFMFAGAPSQEPSLYLGGAMMTTIVVVLLMGLRFPIAALTAVSAIVIDLYGLTHHPMSALSMRNLVAFCVNASLISLFALWRMERESRLTYLLTLRERLRREALSSQNRELTDLASRDKLTGLANRRAYDEWLAASWQQALAGGRKLGLIVLDIDRFKPYNDFYGHAAGDSCLQIVGRCLAEQLRGTTDMLARFGGEEFAVLVPQLGTEPCGEIAERLRLAVERLELPHVGIGPGQLVTISAGAASLPAESFNSPQLLFAMADAALYEAKRNGRNRVCLGMTTPAEQPAAAASVREGSPR